MTDTAEMPVTVPASPFTAELATTIRYALVTIGGIFVSRGWLSDAELNAIVGVVLIVAPTLWGVWATRRNHNKQITMAVALPDAVAQIK